MDKKKNLAEKAVLELIYYSVHHNFAYFDNFTREMGNINSWRASTYAKFAAVRHHLETFNPSLQFADLTEFGLTQYVNYLREVKGMRNTTITKQLGFLKWFLR